MPRVKRDPAARPAVERGLPVKVSEVILDVLAVDEEEITLDAKLCDDLKGDSLDIVELAMAFELEFGIAIDDAVTERWETGTVKDVLTDLRRRGVAI